MRDSWRVQDVGWVLVFDRCDGIALQATLVVQMRSERPRHCGLFSCALVTRRRHAVSIRDDDTLKSETRHMLNDRFVLEFNR